MYYFIAVVIAIGLGIASSSYGADEGSAGQGGMQPGTSKGSIANPESSTPPSSSTLEKKKSGESSLDMPKDQERQKDSPTIPSTKGTTEGRGDRFGESGSGQGSGGGAGAAPGIGNR